MELICAACRPPGVGLSPMPVTVPAMASSVAELKPVRAEGFDSMPFPPLSLFSSEVTDRSTECKCGCEDARLVLLKLWLDGSFRRGCFEVLSLNSFLMPSAVAKFVGEGGSRNKVKMSKNKKNVKIFNFYGNLR